MHAPSPFPHWKVLANLRIRILSRKPTFSFSEVAFRLAIEDKICS
jgi:hypothetical protein